jgi:hypothetical protein
VKATTSAPKKEDGQRLNQDYIYLRTEILSFNPPFREARSLEAGQN